jgi:hypothetical protein
MASFLKIGSTPDQVRGRLFRDHALAGYTDDTGYTEDTCKNRFHYSAARVLDRVLRAGSEHGHIEGTYKKRFQLCRSAREARRCGGEGKIVLAPAALPVRFFCQPASLASRV